MRTIERHCYENGEIVKTRTISFQPYEYTEKNMSLIMGLIRRNLSTDLLTPKYRTENLQNPTYGHCYHASQALYYLINTDKLVPMSGKDYREDYHWWLQNEKRIYDITAEQYYTVGKLPPYHLGKPTKWYGYRQRPHMRTLNLIIKVLGKDKVQDTSLTVIPDAPNLLTFL